MPEQRLQAPLADALADALEAVGDRWALLIVAALLDGPLRFGDLERAVGGIAPNTLSARLRRLAESGIVLAEPYTRRPPRFSYELTERGRELAAPLRLLAGWAARDADAEPLLHEACGGPLEVGLYCPACGERVSGDDPGEVSYA